MWHGHVRSTSAPATAKGDVPLTMVAAGAEAVDSFGIPQWQLHALLERQGLGLHAVLAQPQRDVRARLHGPAAVLGGAQLDGAREQAQVYRIEAHALQGKAVGH